MLESEPLTSVTRPFEVEFFREFYRDYRDEEIIEKNVDMRSFDVENELFSAGIGR